jgi:hypothetical protein
MQQTPREVHDRIYREALQYIKQHSKFPYVAYTEHLSAVVSQTSRRLLLPSRRWISRVSAQRLLQLLQSIMP